MALGGWTFPTRLREEIAVNYWLEGWPFLWKMRQYSHSRRLDKEILLKLVWMVYQSDQNCLVPLSLDNTLSLTVCLNLVLASTMVDVSMLIYKKCKNYEYIFRILLVFTSKDFANDMSVTIK